MTGCVRVSPAAGLCVLLSIGLLAYPTWGSSAVGSGTIVSAERAQVGTAKATAGTTVFSGDTLETDQLGSLQIRAGAARLLLTAATHLTWTSEDGIPVAVLTGGNAVFSTANANAFALRASKALFRPRDDTPTIGNVTILNPKELIVRCSRGALTIAVDDDVREIPEGFAYRVVLDANAPPPADVPQWGNRQTRKAGRSNFIWYAIAFTSVVTAIVVWKALESPDRPK
jgi:hypothetical protein